MCFCITPFRRESTCLVKPGNLPTYEEIDPDLRKACEEVILDKSPDGNHMERFLYSAAMKGAMSLFEVAEVVKGGNGPAPICYKAPIHTLLQGTGTINASLFQQFGSKSHAAFHLHRAAQSTEINRTTIFSSISAWMGQGGSPMGPSSSSLLDQMAWWARAQHLTDNRTSCQWGPVGDIGLRRTVYGSRDAFATGQLGQKLIMPDDTRYILKVTSTFQQLPEFLGLGFMDEATRFDLQRGGDTIQYRDCFPEIKVSTK